MSPDLVPSVLWLIDDAVVIAALEHLGEPTDTYVNGSQVWLVDEAPGDITVEWRLHPVGGYQRPPGTTTTDVLTTVVDALTDGREPPAPVASLWDGLEAFPAYDEEIEPGPLRAWAASLLGIEPDLHGLVDHRVIGDEWERSERQISIVDRLRAQLTP